MVDFLKADLKTDPTPISATVTPTVVDSDKIQMTLGTIPSFTITVTKDPHGSSWQGFNTDVSKHIIEVISNALADFITPTLQTKANDYLKDNATFQVPSLPITVEDVTVTLKPSGLAISSYDDHVMVTGTVDVS